MSIIDFYLTLQPASDDRALQQGFEAAVYDPWWFLARQWQMGEHQGENASTPVSVEYQVMTQKIAASSSSPDEDPQIVPAEAIVEREAKDWWHMGRRIRVGARLGPLLDTQLQARHAFQSPAAPYESFDGAVDGLMLWQFRHTLGFNEIDFGADAPPPRARFAWDSSRMEYQLGFPDRDEGLVVSQHHGGPVDWYSVDAQELADGELSDVCYGVPSPLQYPGAPAARFWQIEDAATDIGGYPPDMAHFPTMLMVDLIYSHGDNWFMLPVMAQAGSVITLKNMTVRDAFGRLYSSNQPQHAAGLNPPQDWHLFRCRGLEPGQLVLWNVAELPLSSRPIESVEMGIDQASNLVWAVERVLDGRDTNSIAGVQAAEAGQTQDMSGKSVDMSKPRNWVYSPSDPPQPFWHPYLRSEAIAEPTFVQHGLANLSTRPPSATPRPLAELLQADDSGAVRLHQLQAASVPSNGIAVERRWMLARDVHGLPKLWIQRQRKPLSSPPARRLRFDITTESK